MSAKAACTPPRGTLRLLVDPRFGTFFWGKLFWATGIWIHGIVAAIVVYEGTRSTLVVGAVGAAQFGPQLLLSPLAGKLADRNGAKAQIVLGESLCAVGSGAVGVWLLAVDDADPGHVAWGVVLSSLIVGIGLAIGGPAGQSIVPSLLRRGELATGIELNTLPMTLSRVAGPAIGAFLLAYAGAGAAFCVAAAASAAFVAMVVWIRVPVRADAEMKHDFRIRAALRFIQTDTALVALLVGVAAVGVGADPSTTLAPAMVEVLHGDATWVGQLTAAFGAGAALGFSLLPTLRHRLDLARLPSLGLVLMGLGLGASATIVSRMVVVGAFGVAGVGMTIALTSMSTQIHLRTPDALRGRVMAIWMAGFLGARPVAALVSGLLSDAVSVWSALLLTAAAVLVAAWLCRPTVVARHDAGRSVGGSPTGRAPG